MALDASSDSLNVTSVETGDKLVLMRKNADGTVTTQNITINDFLNSLFALAPDADPATSYGPWIQGGLLNISKGS